MSPLPRYVCILTTTYIFLFSFLLLFFFFLYLQTMSHSTLLWMIFSHELLVQFNRNQLLISVKKNSAGHLLYPSFSFISFFAHSSIHKARTVCLSFPPSLCSELVILVFLVLPFPGPHTAYNSPFIIIYLFAIHKFLQFEGWHLPYLWIASTKLDAW